jgi:hypothetical protein
MNFIEDLKIGLAGEDKVANHFTDKGFVVEKNNSTDLQELRA